MIMFKAKSLSIIVALFFSLQSLASFSQKARDVMEEGLTTNEALLGFLQLHQCEVGIIDNCDRPMSGHDLAKLKELFWHLANWKKDFEEVRSFSNILKGTSFSLQTGKKHRVTEKKKFSPITFEFEPYLDITLAPLDKASQIFIQNIAISSAATLLMYDSFFRLAEMLAKAKKIRSILELDMGRDGNILHETFSLALDKSVWKETKINLSFLKEAESLINDNDTTYFDQYIANSFTGRNINEGNFSFRMSTLMTMNRILNQNRFFNLVGKIAAKLSKFFGNSVGKIQTRDGKLKALASNPKVMSAMKKKLKPLDIFFEKTPFRLTDYFIPGFYGHVAIWLGNPEELIDMTVFYEGKEIPLLDHPTLLPYLEKLSQGKLVLEALREPGVTLNTLEDFLDVDDFLVVKPRNIRSEGEHLLRAIEQIGKPYDFNFDVETERSIVCSELIYTVFRDEEWPTTRSVGRHTISPDHVAWKAIDSCYKPKIMYHDGKEIKDNMVSELRRLLELRGGISYTPTTNCN